MRRVEFLLRVVALSHPRVHVAVAGMDLRQPEALFIQFLKSLQSVTVGIERRPVGSAKNENSTYTDDPPYNLNHQFVFDISNYYQPTGEFVGLDPGISEQRKHFNDFVVAYPGVLGSNYTFAIQPPLKANKAALFPQGNSIPMVFKLTANTPAGIAMTPPHRTRYGVLLDTNNTGSSDFSGAHQAVDDAAGFTK
jgi:hypothetical protein